MLGLKHWSYLDFEERGNTRLNWYGSQKKGDPSIIKKEISAVDEIKAHSGGPMAKHFRTAVLLI